MAEKRIRILLVEDDPDDVWVMRNLLGDRWDEPFDLVQVELLSAAIERCDEDRFDVILLDLSLPDSRGLETFFAMHAQAGDVPIVVLSGYSDEASAVKAVQAGAEDYLVKGQVNDRMLARSIRYAIERSRRHRAEETMRDTSEEFRLRRRSSSGSIRASRPRCSVSRLPAPCFRRKRRRATISTTFPCSKAASASCWATSAATAWGPPC